MELESSAIAGMIIPDALTPSQYYEGMRADDPDTRAVKRLMLAVLEDAMRCYQTYASTRNRAYRRLFVEAEQWLMDRKGDGPFAFETVCETLGIDPRYLREGLRRWRIQELDGLRPRRLARRSPVTRAGCISSPLRRRRRKSATVAEASPSLPPSPSPSLGVAINADLAAHMNNGIPGAVIDLNRYREIDWSKQSPAEDTPAPAELQEAAVA